MYSKKKILSTFALAVVAANLGLASIAFAQVAPGIVTGTQEVGCPLEVSSAYSFDTTSVPKNFSFPVYQSVTTYQTTTQKNIDPADEFKIISNISETCEGFSDLPGVKLTVQAGEAFKNSRTQQYLSSNGALNGDNALLSISVLSTDTSRARFINCNETRGNCYDFQALNGSSNDFDDATDGGTAGIDTDSLLIGVDGSTPTLTIFELNDNADPDAVPGVGFTGAIVVENVSYDLAIPKNVPTGTFTTTLTYTLAPIVP